MFLLNTLEHFQVCPLISTYFLNFLTTSESSFYIIPNNIWQVLNELLFLGILSVISENIKHRLSQNFFPLIIFILIFGLNSIGLVPFSFVLTGHLIGTMFISLSVFLFTLNYIPLLNFLSLFVLEVFVVVIQSLVFCLLVCIYINDCLNL